MEAKLLSGDDGSGAQRVRDAMGPWEKVQKAVDFNDGAADEKIGKTAVQSPGISFRSPNGNITKARAADAFVHDSDL